ncbi:MAG: YeiH family protein [Blastocatellia bacterium]
MAKRRVNGAIFIVCLGVVLTPQASPPLALAIGLLAGLCGIRPFGESPPAWWRSLPKILLQTSVVGLGFGMDFSEILRVGRAGLIHTAVGIGLTLLAGWLIGRWLKVSETSSRLISVGTAICGGSAIAAVGPILGAREEEMSVALGTVFILNSLALLIFPALGVTIGLDEQQFGLWAALAIHDTSSVVGATAKYGATALAAGTTVKLARALWIVPLAVGLAVMRARNAGRADVQWPWFIIFFLAAALLNSFVTAGDPLYFWLTRLARSGLTVTLFLIGAGLTRATLASTGWRPLLQGTLLWILTGGLTLCLIAYRVIGL